jgi:hypothetical protein
VDGNVELPESMFNKFFKPGTDPYLGYADHGESDHTGKPPKPDDPAYVNFLTKSGILLDGVSASDPRRLILKNLPGVTRVQALVFGRWLARADVAAGFVSGGLSQWYRDTDYGGAERAQRAAIAGGIAVITSALVDLVGTPVSLLCGPFEPFCEAGFIYLGAAAGDWVAGSVSDATGHKPAQHDYKKLGDDVADDTFPGHNNSYDANAGQAAAHAAEARAVTAGDPALQRAIEARYAMPRPTPGPAPSPDP